MYLYQRTNKNKDEDKELMYWRKVNAIHKWFVDNVQNGEDDCGCHTVTLDNLEELYKTIKLVIKEPNSAPLLLPTQAGFFFGDTDYNDYYWQDIKQTRDELKELISTITATKKRPNMYYHSSW